MQAARARRLQGAALAGTFPGTTPGSYYTVTLCFQEARPNPNPCLRPSCASTAWFGAFASRARSAPLPRAAPLAPDTDCRARSPTSRPSTRACSTSSSTASPSSRPTTRCTWPGARSAGAPLPQPALVSLAGSITVTRALVTRWARARQGEPALGVHVLRDYSSHRLQPRALVQPGAGPADHLGAVHRDRRAAAAEPAAAAAAAPQPAAAAVAAAEPAAAAGAAPSLSQRTRLWLHHCRRARVLLCFACFQAHAFGHLGLQTRHACDLSLSHLLGSSALHGVDP